jgi:hypothetical protein
MFHETMRPTNGRRSFHARLHYDHVRPTIKSKKSVVVYFKVLLLTLTQLEAFKEKASNTLIMIMIMSIG